MEEPKVSNIYFYHKDGEIIFKNIFNEGKITNKIEDDKHVGYLIFNKKDDKILSKPILNRSQYEKYLSESEPNIIAQYCIMFPKENPMLYLKEFKRKYESTENKMEELKYKLLDQIVNDSKLLGKMQKEDDMIAFIEDIIVNRDGEKIDISLLFKFYEGIFDLNESEVYKLITYLDYLDSDKLLDVLTYAVYKNIDLTNYYNQLVNTLGKNRKLNFSDNPTRLENFNELILKYKGNMFNILDDNDYFFNIYTNGRLEKDIYFIFIIENQISLAKYFLNDFKGDNNTLFKTIFKYSNDNTLLLWIMNELNITLNFRFLLESLEFNKIFFNSSDLLDLSGDDNYIILNIFEENSVKSLDYLYNNFFDIINTTILSRFGHIMDRLDFYSNRNQIEIFTWLKAKYPNNLFGYFATTKYLEKLFTDKSFEKYNLSYLNFITWLKDNYPDLFNKYTRNISTNIRYIHYTLNGTHNTNKVFDKYNNELLEIYDISKITRDINIIKSDEDFMNKMNYFLLNLS